MQSFRLSSLLQAVLACALAMACLNGTALARQTTPATGAKKHHVATSKETSSHSTHHSAATAKSHKASAHRSSSSHRAATRSSRHSSRRRVKKVRGQQKIDSERAQQIQEALIREHYLSGDATGVWDQASEAAMRKYQADHGWQSKTVPDSRALIKLGLGPSKDHLLNPDSAMTTVPDGPSSATLHAVSHGPEPVGANAAPAAAASPSTSSRTTTGDPDPASSSSPDSNAPQR